MKRWLIVLLVAFLGVVSLRGAEEVSPSSDEALEDVRKVLREGDFAFSPAVRQAYLAYTEAVIRETYGAGTINEKTWTWVKQRPQILSAVASATYPVEPNILLNFQRIGQALGANRMDTWRQLALAYAIRYRSEVFPVDRVKEEWNPQRLESLVSNKKKGKGGDFALLTDEDFPEVTEEEERLGKWIAEGQYSITSTRPPLTIPELMNLPISEINVLTRKFASEAPMLTKFPNWDNVAIGGRIYPPDVNGTPTPQRAILMKIFRNGRLPGKTNRPNFQMEKAEWPILLYLTDLDELDETSFFFNFFVTKKEVPPMGLGQRPTVSGSSDTSPSDPNFHFGRSNFHPRKMIRLYNGSKKDQGGRSWAWGMHALNVAATAVAAPPDGKFHFLGEKGSYSYYLICSDNQHTGIGSSADWYLSAPLTVDNSNPFAAGGKTFGSGGGGKVLHTNFFGLATTLNQGLQEYEDARIGLFIIRALSLSANQRIALLESLFLQNPLNQDVFYSLAAEYRQASNATATLKMLAAARAYANAALKTPVTHQSVKSGRSAMAKIWRQDAVDMGSIPVVAEKQSPWFYLMCSGVATQFLRDTNGKDKALFKAELTYEQEAAAGVSDAPIVKAHQTLGGLLK